MVMARLFGAGAAYDAFLLGFRIPNLMRDLFAEGALSSAFVPTFAETRANRGPEAAFRLANAVVGAILLAVGAVVLVGLLFAPGIVALLAPGFEAEQAELASFLTRLMMPFLLVVSPWWLRNITRFGNPLYPAALPILGRGIFDASKADAAFVPAPRAWPLYPLLENHDEQSGLGGLFAIATLQNGLRLADLPPELTGILTGILLIVAIGADWRPSRKAPAATAIVHENAEELTMRNSQLAVLCLAIVVAALRSARSDSSITG